jgi:hypothetical protein
MSTSIEHDLSDQGSLSRNDSEECRSLADVPLDDVKTRRGGKRQPTSDQFP